MKKALATGIGLLATALASIVLPLAGGHVHAATGSVAVADFLFTDAVSASTTTTITAGDAVIWTWSGSAPHSVTADDASFDDPAGSSKITGTFSHTFNTPGSYGYYCRLHGGPGGLGMSGTVVVQAAPATNTPTSTPTTTSTPAATNTPGPTNTPGTTIPTRTATGRPLATGTPAPSSTGAVSTAAAAPAQAAAAPVISRGGTGAGTQLPRTGNGAAGDTSVPWLSIVLAAAGLAILGGAALARRYA